MNRVPATSLRLKYFLFRTSIGRLFSLAVHTCLILHLANSTNNLRASDFVFGYLQVIFMGAAPITASSLPQNAVLKNAPLSGNVHLNARDLDPIAGPMSTFA